MYKIKKLKKPKCWPFEVFRVSLKKTLKLGFFRSHCPALIHMPDCIERYYVGCLPTGVLKRVS